jgi:hypothetical protein
MKNRTLAIIFILFLVLFAASRIFRGHRQSSFDPVLSAVDTSKVDRIKFNSGGPQTEEFELKKSNNTWEAVQGDKKVAAASTNVKSILSILADLKAKRVLTKESGKYSEYEITEEQASRVTAWQGKKQVADLWIGGFRFDQAARSASSFIRVDKKPEVYLVDGFLSMSLKQRYNQYRDKKLFKGEIEDLISLEWSDAAGKKQVLQKEDGLWYYAGMEAVDTGKIKQYLTGLKNTQGGEFSNLTSTDGLTLSEKLTLHGNNMVEPTVISAYMNQDTLKPFLIHSSENPDGIFLSDTSGIYKRIFGDLRQFWPDGK